MISFLSCSILCITSSSLCCYFILRNISTNTVFRLENTELSQEKRLNPIQKACLKIGFKAKELLKLKSLDEFFLLNLSLGIQETEFKIWLGEIFLSYTFTLALSPFKNSFLNLASAIIFFYSLVRLPLKSHSLKKSLSTAAPHLLECIQILCIRTNTPLKIAFQKISQGLPHNFHSSKNLLIKFINESEEIGMHEALEKFGWNRSLGEDFKNLLIGINQGSSKTELLKFSERISQKYQSAIEIKQNNLIENIQLYLLAPVTLMLLISSYPLFQAIKFSLEGAFL